MQQKQNSGERNNLVVSFIFLIVIKFLVMMKMYSNLHAFFRIRGDMNTSAAGFTLIKGKSSGLRQTPSSNPRY